MPELLTITQYAKRRGVSQPAVSKAISSGRITVVEMDGRRLIDPDVADIQWAKNTQAKASNIDHVFDADTSAAAAAGEIEAEVHDIKAARAKREFHEANIAEMRERREARQLVEYDRVKKAAVDAGAMLRHALEQIPGKISAQLAALNEPAECRSLLNQEIDAVLTDLAENLKRTGNAGA